ncbi:hypothetical protein [Haladaptatus sp. R4]|uniref:hypothetical protein n=1 Tax=Haladaptatus sp. R4 TaxID=1679489 RepID=UPI000A40F48B|nr:hypothetical protein [Haladaptatus sp. R4]
MLRETVLFDALHSELAAMLDDHREIDSDRVATTILENDGQRMLTIGIVGDGLDGNGSHHVDRQRTEGQVPEAVQGLGPEFFTWMYLRYRWVFEPEYRPE